MSVNLIQPEPFKPSGLLEYSHEGIQERDRLRKQHDDQSLLSKIPARHALDKERAEIERKQAELEAKDQAFLDKVNKLNSLARERVNLLKEIDFGKSHAGELQQFATDIEFTLSDWCFPGRHPNPSYQSAWGTMSLVSNAMAAQRALEFFPKWLESREKKLSEIEHEMKTLAQELKVTDNLPPELRK